MASKNGSDYRPNYALCVVIVIWLCLFAATESLLAPNKEAALYLDHCIQFTEEYVDPSEMLLNV